MVKSILLAALALPAAAADFEAFFEPSLVAELRLRMRPADWQSLRDNFRADTVYRADFQWQGEVVEDVGIRSRGAASRNSVKPGLRLDFDHFRSRQRFAGLESVVLDNGVQDPTLIRERLANEFFLRMNWPAPRTTYLRVFVNDEPIGLYILMERIDRSFLQRRLNLNNADLYEFNRIGEYRFEYIDDDPRSYTDRFDPKNDDADLQALVAMIRDANTAADSDFSAVMARHLDYQRLARYLAIENYLAEIDGAAGEFGMNNLYLFRDPVTQRFDFIPWDKDFTFNGVDHPLGYNFEKGVLTRRFFQTPEFRAAYYSALAEAAAAGGEWLEARVLDLRGQVRADAGEGFEAGVDYLLSFARERSGWVQRALSEVK